MSVIRLDFQSSEINVQVFATLQMFDNTEHIMISKKYKKKIKTKNLTVHIGKLQHWDFQISGVIHCASYHVAP
jgi:hypothetical protein